MADWYVSSAAYALLPQWQASHAYTIGNIIRPLGAQTIAFAPVFRCITAGTSGTTEPGWSGANGNNNTIGDGGVTWVNVAGQSAYGWAAASPNLFSLTWNGSAERIVVGDRVFLSSDHVESATNNNYSMTSTSFGSVSVVSVNRAGSVPPVPADAQSGAALNNTGSSFVVLDANCNEFYQGVTFGIGGSCAGVWFANSATKMHYFKNCAFVFTTSNANATFSENNPAINVFDNTTVTFNAAGQHFALSQSYAHDFTWINTPAAILGTVPTSLFIHPGAGALMTVLCRGVDLSALNTTLLAGGSGSASKMLLDSCRINPSLVRLGTASYNTPGDEVELVNCHDGTSILSERHTPFGDLTTEFIITLAGGAQDNVGLFSHKMISSSRSDKYAGTLDGFWMDLNLVTVGGVRTASVEIISSGALNTDDIALQVEYQGTVGSSLAAFVTSFPAVIPATPVPLTTSGVTWNSQPATPVQQRLSATFLAQTPGRLRARVRLGKPSTTVYVNPQIAIS